MPSHQNSMLTRLLTTLITAFLMAASGWAQAAEEHRVEALEARIAQLETLVQQLVATQGDPPAVPDQVATPLPKSEEPETREPRTELSVIEVDDTPRSSYEFGGYVKFDAITSKYSDGKLGEDNPGRQFYIPATVPVGGTGGFDPQTDFQARETRIFFKSDHALDGGGEVSTYLEMDFFLGLEGDESVSNSYQPRMRQAFFRYNDWLFGQTWSTFYNVTTCPENLDFIGPAEGTVLMRQAQVRYTHMAWSFALENPQTTITPFGGGGRIDSDDNTIPDLVVRYRRAGTWGNFTAAVLARNLEIEEPFATDSALGYGISLGGRHQIGARDDVRWMASAGRGIGRYIGLNISSDAVLDVNGKLDPIDEIGAFASIRHFWSGTWRTNLTLSGLKIDNNTSLTGTSVTNNVYSTHLNLLYDPVPRLTVGAEWIYANREIESGESGDMNRLMVSAKYIY